MAGGLSSGAVGRLEALNGNDEVAAFLAALVDRGLSSYTLRTYGLGLEHFVRWLVERGVELEGVDRAAVVEYVTQFARGERDGVAVGRAPPTVNHRVSVLASFFVFLIERDGLAGDGVSAVAQEVLGHANVSTTARSYARVDEAAMVAGLAAAREVLDPPAPSPGGDGPAVGDGEAGFVFAYDPDTLAELDQATRGAGR